MTSSWSDNASGLPALTRAMQSIAEQDPRVGLLLRETNDITRNSKVGGLYDAYAEIVEYALDRGYDYLHIIQHDMQMVWWDETVIARAREIFAEYPECVNIATIAPARHLALCDACEQVKPKLIVDEGLRPYRHRALRPGQVARPRHAVRRERDGALAAVPQGGAARHSGIRCRRWRTSHGQPWFAADGWSGARSSLVISSCSGR